MASIPGPDISDFPVVDGVNVPAMTAWCGSGPGLIIGKTLFI